MSTGYCSGVVAAIIVESTNKGPAKEKGGSWCWGVLTVSSLKKLDFKSSTGVGLHIAGYFDVPFNLPAVPEKVVIARVMSVHLGVMPPPFSQ